MEVIQEQILQLTQANDYDNALNIVVKDYIKYKLYYLKNENNRFEIKWGATFDEFEKNKDNTTYEHEQEYYQWEAVVTELDYFKNMLYKWK